MTGSNRRPSRCKRDALPAELTAPQEMRSNASVWEMQKKTSAIAMMADALEEDLVYGVFECFAGLELRLVRRAYLNCFAGPRITTRCRFAMRNRERAETYEPNFALCSSKIRRYCQKHYRRHGQRQLLTTRYLGQLALRDHFCSWQPLLTRFIMLQHKNTGRFYGRSKKKSQKTEVFWGYPCADCAN